MTIRPALLWLLICTSALSRPPKGEAAEEVKKAEERGAAASAAEIPALARLLTKAGWVPTPELSGIFLPGRIFERSGTSHQLLSGDCFAAASIESPYTAAELVTSLHAGVAVGGLFSGGSASGELVKKVKFGTPKQLSIPKTKLSPSKQCLEEMKRQPRSTIAASYVVQEALLAEVSEQTCGRIDASGRFVGLGAADAELAMACAQSSLEPVVVGFRTLPLAQLLGMELPEEEVRKDETSGGGDIGEERFEVNDTLAQIRAADALKKKLTEERAACMQRERQSLLQRAAADARALAPLLEQKEAGARAIARPQIQKYVDKYGKAEIYCKNELGELRESVVVPELAQMRSWLEAPAAGAASKGMVLIPKGSFQMGSPTSEAGRDTDEGPLRTVQVDAFYMATAEVTQGEYRALMGVNPSVQAYEGQSLIGDSLPVQNVSWMDAVKYANRLSEKEGLEPAYTISGDSVTWDRKANGYRLPTEAEWEYAARAGSTTAWWGASAEAGICKLGNVADAMAKAKWSRWTAASCSDGFVGLAPVRSFAPNAWGLYDTVGNVFEWCWDWYAPYDAAELLNPAGPPRGEHRVVRGGSWYSWPSRTRSAVRNGLLPTNASSYLGFRLVRLAPPA